MPLLMPVSALISCFAASSDDCHQLLLLRYFATMFAYFHAELSRISLRRC